MSDPWGRPPTNPDPVPMAEQANESIRLKFATMLDRNGQPLKNSATGRFSHPADKRLWTIEIMQLPCTHPFSRYKHNYITRISSHRVVSVSYLSDTLTAAKKVASRFANLDATTYEVFVVDAAGTTSHPISGPLVAVRVSGVVSQRTGWAAEAAAGPVAHYGYGRAVGARTIKLFPGWDEVDSVLETLLGGGDACVNDLVHVAGLPERLATFDRMKILGYGASSCDSLADPARSEPILQEAPAEGDNTSLEDFLHPQPPGREDRFIQL